jgi:hypothetical protein
MSFSLNSLVWLLIVIRVIAAVVVVVRAVLAGAGPPPSEPPVVREQPVVQQPVQNSGLAPGWYPDQNDPNSIRYFDGRVWTSSTRPRT